MISSFEMGLNLSTLSIAGVTTLLVLFGAVLLRRSPKENPLMRLPSPNASSALFGHLFDLYVSVINWKTTQPYPEPFLSWVKTYGGAIYLREFMDDKVLLSDPQALQHVMVTNAKNYPHEPVVEGFFADATMGPGLLSTNDAAHDRFRKILNLHFTSLQVKTFVELFHTHALQCCNSVLAKASLSQTSIDLGAVLKQLVLKIVGLAAFNYDFNQDPAALTAYHDFMMEMNPFLFVGIFLIPGFLHFPLPVLLRRRRAQYKLKDLFVKTINERLAAKSTQSGKTKDLLDLMLPYSTTKEAITHTISFMVGGHEPPMAVLGYIFAFLCSHPESVDRIRQEYRQALAMDPNFASGDALSALPYTLAVVNETMRLHPAVYELADRITREGDADVPMSDGSFVYLSKGTKVQINIASMHRNPKYWSNPDSFIPNRFMEGTKEWNDDLELRQGKSHAFIFMPFGAGSKQCIGYRFALAEMQVIVATFLSKFDFKLANIADIGPMCNLQVLQPANLQVVVTPVSGSIDKIETPWMPPARSFLIYYRYCSNINVTLYLSYSYPRAH